MQIDPHFLPLADLQRDQLEKPGASNVDLLVPVAIISLSDMTNRRQQISDALPNRWVEEFFPASDMRHAARSECESVCDMVEISRLYGRRLAPAEIGCALSHKRVYSSLLETQCNLALVLEDDSLPEHDFFPPLSKVASCLIGPAGRGESFICNVGLPKLYAEGHIARRMSLAASSDPARVELLDHIDPRFGLWRANAYFISRKAAMDVLKSEPCVNTLADDWSIRRRRGSVGHVLFTKRPLFHQDAGLDSTIETGRSKLQREALPAPAFPSIGDRALRALLRRLEITNAKIKSCVPLKM